MKTSHKIALMIFLFFFVFYSIFLTNNYFVVDGASRCMEVFLEGRPIIHQNNHLLYTFNVYLWYEFTSILLGRPANQFGFIRRIQLMNAFCASIILALSYLIYLHFMKKRKLSLALVILLAISNAFFVHSTASAEPMSAFLFFLISFYLIVLHYNNESRYNILFISSAFMLAYSVMSYLSMLFGLFAIMAYIYHKQNGKKTPLFYFAIFMVFFILMFVGASYHKGITVYKIGEAFSSNQFHHTSHVGFKLKNFPKYIFGMINGFLHIDKNYDLHTYTSSILNFNLNSLFSILFGSILFIILLLLVCKNNSLFVTIKRDIKNRNISLITFSLIYFVSASLPLLEFSPLYDKLWIMGLNAFLLFGGVAYTMLKKTKIIKCLFVISILIILIFNLKFAIKSKEIPEDLYCVKSTIPLIENKYILLSTWNSNLGLYFQYFYNNNHSKYYSIPNLAIDHSLQTKEVLLFLKQEFCINETLQLYATSDVMMNKNMWNTFLGDEMNMNYSLFHGYLLNHSYNISRCLYRLNKSRVCKND